jgi:enoyl-CoA hydratase
MKQAATGQEHSPMPISALAGILSSPWEFESLSAVGSRPLLLLDTHPNTDDEKILALCKQWLPQLPCPVIGIGLQGKLSPYTDTNVACMADARAMITNICRHPLTAMTLVQLLRHNEQCSVEQGLLAESLAYATLQSGAEFHAWLARQAPLPALASEDESILAQRLGNDLRITLNRPRQRNAFSSAMRDRLTETLHLLTLDLSIRKATIRGAGTCFCVGGDLAEFGTYTDTATAHAIRSTRHAGRLIHQHRTRIDCHLHRACIGAGIELPAFAERVTASDNSFFALPEITMGLVPGAGGTVSILRRIGRQKTAWLALSGKRINAQSALALGLIDDIVSPSPV